MTTAMTTGLLALRKFFIRERVGFFRWSKTYDLFEPDSQAQVRSVRARWRRRC
ncbi:MAG: hypothetical protein JST92_18905 [Deltaproteobacteria bacterium]|nr:hypothetical protein [Deltaproteobacteria bacterium]